MRPPAAVRAGGRRNHPAHTCILLRKGFSLEKAVVQCTHSRDGQRKKKIIYPKSLKDIPRWRRRELAENLEWFLRFSPVERLRYIDREWEETCTYIEKYSLVKRWKAKKN